MRVLGLTGGIGSGKSTVASIFEELGAEVIDADLLAREIVEPGQPALADIVQSFGADILRPDGQLDREKLAAIVFSDAAALGRLNAITHPRIHERMQAEVEARRPRAGLLILDIPLLFESARRDMVERVIVAWVDPQTQLDRLRERDRVTETEARRRIAAQMSLEKKKDLADEVVDNTGTRAQTRAQVESLYRRYG
jgi:dephospho-CoA kinase